MTFLKRLLVVLAIFLVLMVLISFFLPSSLQFKRLIIVDADKNQVFNQINDLKHWKNWSSWALQDSLIYKDAQNYSNPSIGKGASFQWESDVDDVGAGRMEIVNSKKNQKVEYKVDFGMSEVFSEIYLKDVDEGVEVSWTFFTDFGFNPINKFFGLFMKDVIEKDYELGLKRLKEYAEELPKINSVKVEKKEIKQQWFLSIRDTFNQKESTNVHGKLLEKISDFMKDNQISFISSPIVIYHSWSDTIIDIEAGIPIHDSMTININHSKIKLNKINQGYVVTATHYGPYERLIETYNGINEWMRKNEVVVTGPPWEEYITDPTNEPNPNKWETAIFFTIE